MLDKLIVVAIPGVVAIVGILLCETVIKIRDINQSKIVDDEDEEQQEEIKETSQYGWLQDRFNRTN